MEVGWKSDGSRMEAKWRPNGSAVEARRRAKGKSEACLDGFSGCGDEGDEQTEGNDILWRAEKRQVDADELRWNWLAH